MYSCKCRLGLRLYQADRHLKIRSKYRHCTSVRPTIYLDPFTLEGSYTTVQPGRIPVCSRRPSFSPLDVFWCDTSGLVFFTQLGFLIIFFFPALLPVLISKWLHLVLIFPVVDDGFPVCFEKCPLSVWFRFLPNSSSCTYESTLLTGLWCERCFSVFLTSLLLCWVGYGIG